MSNIYFKKLTFQNFMSYECAEIELNKLGYILVNGENQNPEDSANSNGCGKSTIFNAIAWVLTGKTVSGSKDVSNIYLNGETFVELEFDLDDDECVVKRTKNPSNLKIIINGENKSGKGIRDSEKLLNEFMPEISDELINSVIILGQGLPQRFTNNTPSGRKEVLETLSKSDFMIEDLKNKLSIRKQKLEQSLRTCQDEELKNNTSIDMLNQQLIGAKEELKSLPSKNELISKITINSLKINECETQKKKVENEYNILNDKKNKLNNDILVIEKEKEQALSNAELEDVSDLHELIFETEVEIKSKQIEINKLDSVVDVCPTCGQKLPDVHKIDTAPLKEELENLKHDLETYEDSYETITKENEKIVSDIENEYTSKSLELIVESENIQRQLNDLSHVLVNDYVEKLDELKKQLSEAETYMTIRKNKEQELKSNIKNIEDKIVELNQKNIVISNKTDKLNKQLEVNSKMTTIVKRDFRGYLLKNVIDFISIRCKYYSNQIFGTDKLDFKLNGNNISITYDEKEYELLSGGEKQKVDVILQFSIRDMLCSYLNFSSNILVLDEITDSLDEIGAQKVFNLISNNLTDVETVYIISHHKDFSIPVDDEIRIVKGVDKISRIV